MAVPNVYPIDTEIQVNVQFNALSNGAPIDPSDVVLWLLNPNGTAIELYYSLGQITRTGIGAFAYAWTPTISGAWIYKFQAIGAVIATSFDQPIIVAPSLLIAG